MNRHVLFFDFAYDEFLPIVEACSARGLTPIMNQPRMRDRLARSGVPVVAFESFADPSDASAAAEAAGSIGARVSSGVTKVGAAEAFDTPYGNLLVAGGSTLVRAMIGMAQNQVLIARIVTRIIDQTNLSAVVMRSCLSAGQRAVQLAAESRGVPVLELMHGNPGWTEEMMPPSKSWHMAVFGDRDRRMLSEWRMHEDRIHVTGGPQWDILYHPDSRPGKAEARARIGLDRDTPVVLFTGSFVGGDTAFFAPVARDFLTGQMQLVDALSGSGATLIVRPHPGESRNSPGRVPNQEEVERYTRRFSERGIHVHSVDYDDTVLVAGKAALFRAADVMVTCDPASTVITESLIMGCPPIVLDSGVNPQRRYYSDADGVTHVADHEELRGALERLMPAGSARSAVLERIRTALPDINCADDGRSVERVADVVDALAVGAPNARTA